ncbi:unnamed protein product [Merluccius merluccius]
MAAREEDEDDNKDNNCGNDPGAAPYGNFINYYTFNPPENRLSLLPNTLLRDLGYRDTETVLMLDVGCNSGDLSVALYRHLVPIGPETGGTPMTAHVLGFDLDASLVLRAQQTNPLPGNISFIPLDIAADPQDPDPLRDYLTRHGCARFHVCFCFAVTMWIHLNHGDAALLRFLSRLAALSRHVVLEAQPWKCYRAAARRLRKLGRADFEHFRSLELRGDVAEHARAHLETRCGMALLRCFGSTAWDRKLLLFRRNSEE